MGKEATSGLKAAFRRLGRWLRKPSSAGAIAVCLVLAIGCSVGAYFIARSLQSGAIASGAAALLAVIALALQTAEQVDRKDTMGETVQAVVAASKLVGAAAAFGAAAYALGE